MATAYRGEAKIDLLTELPDAFSLGGLYGCRAGWLGCLLVIIDGDIPRELSGLVVSRRGSLEATGDLFAPYHLVDAKVPRSLRRQGSSLSWPRAGVPRRRSVPTGWTCCAGSGSCGRCSGTGIRRLGRRRVISAAGCRARSSRCARIGVIPMVALPGADAAATTGGARNAVTGKPPIGDRYDASTVAHCESVLRGFYDFRLEAGTGPMVNPFPLTRHRRAGRADAHHNPMKPFAREPQRPVPAEGGGACSSVHPRRAVQRSRCTIRHASF